MIKKRLIFTLLYNDGFFVQSRNFNLQKVGDTHWIKKNYNFRNISFYIDELLILDISRNTKNKIDFMKSVREISDSCFVPITVGGGVKNVEDASYFLSNGCDKILINSELHNNKEVVSNISKTYGDQSIILSIDFKRIKNNFQIFFNNGQDKSRLDFKEFFEEISTLNYGELYLNSIDRDGTGNGLELDIINHLPKNFSKPIILAGGCGNADHIKFGLEDPVINAVSTSNLLNFVGDGLIKAREQLINQKISFPIWDTKNLKKLEKILLKINV